MNSKYIKIIKNNQGIQLFCLPYAGGNASIYYGWRKKISTNIKLMAIQLPGRAELFLQQPISIMDSLIETLYIEIKPYLDKPFAFFGHSMGGIIVYALTQYIEKVSNKKPQFIIISAAKPPHFYFNRKDHLLSKEKLKEKLKINNFTPKIVLNSKELMDIILPIYQSDCKLLELSKINEFPPVKTDVFIFSSEEDISKKILLEWSVYFDKKIIYKNFKGGHFFIHEQESEVIKEISSITNEMN